MSRWLKLYAHGLIMGVADLIPGVSGGTVAFVSGLHPKLVNALKTLRVQAFLKPKTIAWFLLSAIVLGILTSIACVSHLIFFLLNDHIYQCLLRSLFMGLMIGSIFFCLRKISSWKMTNASLLFAGMFTALFVGHISHHASREPIYDVPMALEMPPAVLNEASNYDGQKRLLKDVKWSNLKALYQNQLIDADTWIFSHDFNRFLQVESCLENDMTSNFHLKLVACGACSIGAMILPGISGNQIMQMMGLYEVVIEAITEFTSGVVHGAWESTAFWILFSLALGIFAGVIAFSRLLTALYKNFFEPTLATMVGFMAGSLVSVWPFWETTYHLYVFKDRYRLALQRISPKLPTLTSYQTGLALLMVLLGVLLVVSLERRQAFEELNQTGLS